MRIIEPLHLEETFKNSKSNHQPNTVNSTIKLISVKHLISSTTKQKHSINLLLLINTIVNIFYEILQEI